MTRRLTPDELDRRRCSAKAKATGCRCRRWAVKDYNVCVVHGAGAPVRRTRPGPDGRRRADPRTAPLIHGVYAKYQPEALADVVSAMLEAEDELFDLKTVAARLWALLISADAVEDAAFAGTDLSSEAGPVLQAMNMVLSVLRELRRVIEANERIERRTKGLSFDQLTWMIGVVVLWAHDLAHDEAVPRAEIGPRLMARLLNVNAELHQALSP
jgi:hypothetical protein